MNTLSLVVVLTVVLVEAGVCAIFMCQVRIQQAKLKQALDASQTQIKDSQAQMAMLRTVVDSAPVAIVLTQDPGRVLYSNEAARQLFFEGKPLEGQDFLQLLIQAPAPLRDAVASDEDALFSVEEGGDTENYHLSKRQSVLASAKCVLLTVNNLTQQLRRQDLAVWKNLVRVISHELNNSLAPMGSLSHSARALVKDACAGTSRLDLVTLERIFDTIDDRVMHLSCFVAGYASLARLPLPRPAWHELSELAERVRHWEPSLRMPERVVGRGWYDPGQIEQVLLNLLRNAQEAGGAREEIEVNLEHNPNFGTMLSVADRGCGMTDEVAKSAVVPFFSTKENGTGLGLALCREIVEGHRGRLRLESREGAGTKVSIWLPDPDRPIVSRAKLTLSRT